MLRHLSLLKYASGRFTVRYLSLILKPTSLDGAQLTFCSPCSSRTFQVVAKLEENTSWSTFAISVTWDILVNKYLVNKSQYLLPWERHNVLLRVSSLTEFMVW